MKVYLIKVSAPGPFKEYKKMLGAPPQNIFSVAAATPSEVELELCDETIGMKPKRNIATDVVALFFHTPDAVHAYELADQYRRRGICVVLGGLHPSFLPDEAGRHADAVLIGEAEGVWEELLSDQRHGQLKATYQRSEPVDLATVKPYPTHLIPPAKYGYLWSVLVARGCVHHCEYCAVPPFFCGKYRLRPIENIVAEIKALPEGCWVELHADHLAANREYSLALFEALRPLNINWVGESTIAMADDEELLRAAAKSGCQELLIGIETPSQSALSAAGKEFVNPDQIREKIQRFHAYGIRISSSMIFGFDSQTRNIFQESLDFCHHIELDHVDAVMLIPFPGTPLFERLEKEGRISDRDWSHYNGSDLVFQPRLMTPAELLEGVNWFWQKTQKINRTHRGKIPQEPPSLPTSTKPGPVTKNGGGFRVPYWKSLLALAAITTSLVFNLYWVWGILFLLWSLQDLRSGHTYLMELIPRRDAPLLYWAVVLLWLVLGIWSLKLYALPYFAAEASVEKALIPVTRIEPENRTLLKQSNSVAIKAPMKTEPSSKQAAAPSTPTPRVKNALARYQNDRFDFSISVPAEWNAREKRSSDRLSFDFENKLQTGTLNVYSMELQNKLPINRFIAESEQEISKNLDFVSADNASEISASSFTGKPGIDLSFREYRGNYQGYSVIVLAGFGVRKTTGYSLLAVHLSGDDKTRQQLTRALRSFKLR